MKHPLILKNWLFLILSLVGLGSCTHSAEKSIPVVELSDLIIDTIFLEKDTLTKNLGANFTYSKTDSGQVLTTFLMNKLLVYSFPEGKLLRVQYFDKEGPNGIGGFVTGSFIDDTSLYLLSEQKNLIEITFQGEVLNRWKLPEVSTERKYANYSSYLYNHLQRHNDDLYFVDIPYVFVEGFEKYDQWGMIFDLKEQDYKNFRFAYPSSVLNYTQDDQLGLFSHVFNPETQEHLVSFAISDSLAIVKNGVQTWKWAGTSETLNFKKGTTEPSGEYTIFRPAYESSKYLGIAIDTYSNKILRWVRVKGPTLENPEQQRDRLLVFDQDINAVAEINFDTSELGQYGFNTPKGYALPLYSKTTDDKVAYAILDFSKFNP